jgi:hypothetical protein
MFAQVIRGRVADPEAVAIEFRRWVTEVAPAASGWHDATAGVTADGQFLAVARFASEPDARTSSPQAERRAWWQNARALFDDEPALYESADVTELWKGRTTEAGFVQMMLATVADRRTVERIEEELDEAFRRWRPDAIGGYRVWLPDGRMLAVDYFSSEAEARAGEQSDPPAEVAEAFPSWMAQMSDQEWFDFTVPWIAVASTDEQPAPG